MDDMKELTSEEMAAAVERVRAARKAIVDCMRATNLTPTEGFTTITGVLFHMYDTMIKDPSIDDFVETFGGMYALHFKMSHMPDSSNTIQ